VDAARSHEDKQGKKTREAARACALAHKRVNILLAHERYLAHHALLDTGIATGRAS